jgi:hypothetical protein
LLPEVSDCSWVSWTISAADAQLIAAEVERLQLGELDDFGRQTLS